MPDHYIRLCGTGFVIFWHIPRHYILVFILVPPYLSQNGGAQVSLNLPCFYSLSSLFAQRFGQIKYSRILLYNTKPSPSLRRTFSRRNSRKKNRPVNKMAAPEASVHPVRNRLCYHSFLYQTNESCSQIVS